MKKILWGLTGIFGTLIGIYPAIYFLSPENAGFLDSKTPELLASLLWNAGFYAHIIFGGIGLLVGWTQFSKKIRQKRLSLHRSLGKIYVVSVLISSVAGTGIGFVANGGFISSAGFISLGVIWFTSTLAAYRFIRQKQISKHKKAMIFSYAACFAAVTLRLYLPFLDMVFDDFIDAYRTVAWLCWVPNMGVAWLLTRKKVPKLSPAAA